MANYVSRGSLCGLGRTAPQPAALWMKDPNNYADKLAESSLVIVEVMFQTKST